MSELFSELTEFQHELEEKVKKFSDNFQIAQSQYKQAKKSLKQQVRDIETTLIAHKLSLDLVRERLQALQQAEEEHDNEQ